MKLLNEKAVNDRFVEKYGFDPENMQEATQALEVLQDHYNFEIVETYASSANFYIYEESTADGYSVYVATSNLNSVCVTDEIYYYSSDLPKLAKEVMSAGDTLAVDTDEDFFIEAVEELYAEFIDEAYASIENELIDEGYTEEISNPESSLGLLDMIYQKMKVTESSEYIFGIPEQTTDSNVSDIKLNKFYTQICLDVESFRKYARKVLNCKMFLAGNNTIQLTIIPVE